MLALALWIFGPGIVLARLGAGAATADGSMAWSWLRILGRRRGPWVRMGDRLRTGVVLRVLVWLTDSEGDSKE